MRQWFRAGLILAFFSLPAAAQAVPFCSTDLSISVSTTNDGSDCSCSGASASVSNCTLMGAITLASTNTASTTVTLAAGTYSPATTMVFGSLGAGPFTLQAAEGAAPVIDGSNLGSIATGFIYMDSVSSDVSIQGIAFNNGSTTGDGGALYVGGAFGASFSFTLQNCSFENNQTPYDALSPTGSGGAVYVTADNTMEVAFSITGNTFINNHAAYGGALYLDSDSSPGSIVFTGNTVQGNTAVFSNGGVRLASLGPVTIGGSDSASANTFESNETSDGYYGGGSISSGSNLIFSGNSVLSNQATAIGGGMQVSAMGGSMEIEHNIVNGNSSGTIVGGLYVSSFDSTDVSINANQFSNNTDSIAGYGGGAAIIFNSAPSGSAVISNNLVYKNATDYKFGGMGVIIRDSMTLDVVNNTITQNSVVAVGPTVSAPSLIQSGGGLGFSVQDNDVTVNLYNNIIYGNSVVDSGTGQDISIETNGTTGTTLNVYNNDFDLSQICLIPDTSNPQSITCGLDQVAPSTSGDNLDNVDPSFADASAEDFNLLSTSALLGQGSASAPGLPAYDFTGTVAMNTPPDLGALQYVLNQVSLDVSSYDFGEFGSGSSVKTFTLSNTGTQSASINDIDLSNDTDFSLDFGTSGSGSNMLHAAASQACSGPSFTLPAGQSCSFNVVFNPQSIGAITGNLNISYASSSTLTTPLSGYNGGVGGGGCGLNPSSPRAFQGGWVATFLLFLLWRRKSQLS